LEGKKKEVVGAREKEEPAFPGMPKDGEKVFPNPLRQWGKGGISSPHKLL